MNPRAGTFLRGALAMGAALAMTYAAGAFVLAAHYPPARLASLVVNLTPGDLATTLIERLGRWAMRALNAAVHGGLIGAGGYLAVLIRRAPHPAGRARRALASAGGLLLGFLLLSLTGAQGLGPAAAGVYLLSAYAFARLCLGARLLRTALEPDVRPGEAPLDALQRSRRRFLVRAGAAAGGFVLGGAATLRFLAGKLPVDVEIAAADRPFAPPPPDPGFPSVPGLSPEITPNRDFYLIDINLLKPRVDHTSWRLKVHGLVDRPYALSYRQLQEEFEVVEMAHTLTCISNVVGGPLISTAVWRGVRLKDVLERGGLEEGVVDVVFRAAEGYSDSVPLARAIEETTLVVFGMNGVALPREHGFPARIIVPGIYGMKNVKWLTEIETVDHDYRGYWMVRGWSDVATVKTQSRIDVPRSGDSVPLPARVAGVAWAGDRRVARVEVSEDEGESWRPALLKRELSPVAWRLWAAGLAPASGRRRIQVRASDGTGEVQTARRTRPHPDGASGLHSVTFEVE